MVVVLECVCVFLRINVYLFDFYFIVVYTSLCIFIIIFIPTHHHNHKHKKNINHKQQSQCSNTIFFFFLMTITSNLFVLVVTLSSLFGSSVVHFAFIVVNIHTSKVISINAVQHVKCMQYNGNVISCIPKYGHNASSSLPIIIMITIIAQ